MISLNISDNHIGSGAHGSTVGSQALSGALKSNSTLKELDVSSNYFRADDAKILADGISGNGAISSINLLRNSIPVEQAQELVKIMQAKEKLTTLCGLSKEEAKLDFSNQGLGPGDVVLIANDIRDMGALSKLDASDNGMFGKKDKAGITAWADALKANTSITQLNLAKNGINANDTKILAPAISDNGALTSLDISDNKLTNNGSDMSGKPREHVLGLLI
jgi:Ran GTPase-activating protein (RanGAP) involved in mRNA processing and transport